MLLGLLALAFGAELTCELRGLEVRIVYDESGRFVVYDGEEVLAEADGGEMELAGTRATCAGDRFRLVRGGNVAADGDHATLAVGTVEVNFAAMLDVLPPERFDAQLSALRRARRAAFAGDWMGMERELAAAAPIDKNQRDSVVEVLLQRQDEEGLMRGWALVAGSQSPLRKEVGMGLAQTWLDEGKVDDAEELLLKMMDIAPACELAGRIPWAQGKKSKARKRWETCEVLTDEARGWCGTCP